MGYAFFGPFNQSLADSQEDFQVGESQENAFNYHSVFDGSIIPSAAFVPNAQGIYTFPHHVLTQLFQWQQTLSATDAIEITLTANMRGSATLAWFDGSSAYSSFGGFASPEALSYGYVQRTYHLTTEQGYLVNGNQRWRVHIISNTNLGTSFDTINPVTGPNGGQFRGLTLSIRERSPNEITPVSSDTTEFIEIEGVSGDILGLPNNPRFEFSGIPLREIKTVSLTFTSNSQLAGSDRVATWIVNIDQSLINLVTSANANNFNAQSGALVIFRTEGVYHFIRGVNYYDQLSRFSNSVNLNFYYLTNNGLLEGLSLFNKNFESGLNGFNLTSMRVEKILRV